MVPTGWYYTRQTRTSLDFSHAKASTCALCNRTNAGLHLFTLCIWMEQKITHGKALASLEGGSVVNMETSQLLLETRDLTLLLGLFGQSFTYVSFF